MRFEKFTSYGRGFRPVCSIRANAQIGFNRGAIHRYGLSQGFAVLYFSKDDNVIGVQPVADANVEGATKLIVKDNNAYLSARSFLEYYNIPYGDEAKQYSAEWSDEHNMVLIDLEKPIKRTRDRSADE